MPVCAVHVYLSMHAYLHGMVLSKQRSRRGQDTLTAGIFVADEANAGQAGMVTAVTAEGLIKAQWQSIVVPPVLLFLRLFSKKIT